MLFQNIETHSRMQKDHDRQWIHTALAFVKSFVDGDGVDILSGLQNRDQYITRLMEAVIEASTRVEGGPFVFNSFASIGFSYTYFKIKSSRTRQSLPLYPL